MDNKSELISINTCIPKNDLVKIAFFGRDTDGTPHNQNIAVKNVLDSCCNLQELEYLIMLNKKRESTPDLQAEWLYKANITFITQFTLLG